MKPTNVKQSDWIKYNILYVLEHFLGRKLFLRIFDKHEKKLWHSIQEHAEKVNIKNPFEIEEFFDVSEYPEELWHPYNVRVFRNAAKNWPATKKWTFDHFSEKYGHKEVTLFRNIGLHDKKSDQNFETVTLKEYIKLLKSGSKKYLKFSRMVHEESDLYEDFNMNWIHKFQFAGKFNNLFYLFMGGKDTFTPVHNALPPTVFVQIQGSKKWWFAPTSDRIFLHGPADRRNYNYTNADPDVLDDPKYPLMKYANWKTIILNEGDVVWFPALVWHQVHNISDSIGVAYKFQHIPSSLKSSKVLTILCFLSTRPFIFYNFFVNKIYKKDSIFDAPH